MIANVVVYRTIVEAAESDGVLIPVIESEFDSAVTFPTLSPDGDPLTEIVWYKWVEFDPLCGRDADLFEDD